MTLVNTFIPRIDIKENLYQTEFNGTCQSLPRNENIYYCRYFYGYFTLNRNAIIIYMILYTFLTFTCLSKIISNTVFNSWIINSIGTDCKVLILKCNIEWNITYKLSEVSCIIHTYKYHVLNANIVGSHSDSIKY